MNKKLDFMKFFCYIISIPKVTKMKNPIKAIKLAFFICLLAAVFYTATLPIIAQENSLIEEGIKLYRQEDYDEALAVFKKAREEDPASTLAAYYAGLTCKQIQDYKQAEIHLRDAVTFTPKIKDALLELVEVLYQLGKLEEAKSYVETAEREKIKPAQTAFLKGLVLLKEGSNLEAVEAFEKAKALDESLTQSADYQIGLAYLKEKKYKKAKDVFKEVIIVDPNSDRALYANQYMEAISKKEEAERPFDFTLGFAYQYDDNVILKPGDVIAVADIANEDDTREVLTFRGEYTQRLTDRMKLKLQHSIYWAAQNSLDDFDVFSNTSTISPSYYFERASVSVPVSYNYTTVGQNSYLSSIGVTPLCNFMLGSSNMLQLFFKYQNKDFLRSPANANEDRDADSYSGGAGLFWFFADNKGFVNIRYELNRDDTEGSNWEQLGNKFTATTLIPLFDKLKISASGEAYLQDFENRHTVFGTEREDDVYTANCMLAYSLFKDAEIQFRYTYVKNNSNIAVYDYDRNIYSGGIEYKF